ncbi:YbaB/EbfC family nucleoid-associated protein [Nonomuraea sp. B1E8]|uniref:YbaB/EbfC family nucleoid-associated protein n=1 Tax=unclassified Nonomuraea TaxID=2593643 RepID=UPI00325D0702
MTPPAEPLDAAGNQELGRLLKGYHEDVAALERLNEQVTAVRGRGEAAQGRVVAETSQTGGLTGLTIDPRAMRLGSDALAEAILEAAGEAARDAEQAAADLVTPFLAGTPLDDGTRDDPRGGRRR